MILSQILNQFGLEAGSYQVIEFGSGLINRTWKVCGKQNYILQQINVNVFSDPAAIDRNLSLLSSWFKEKHPGYLFVSQVHTVSGNSLVQAEEGYFRLFPFVEGSVTLTEVSKPAYAYEAARQFGLFTFLLKEFDAGTLSYTLPGFHDLELRFQQFQKACDTAGAERREQAADAINFINDHSGILETYRGIISHNELPLRVIHHDTKISNVLFDETGRGLCVIDLDTVMPGHFISDVGDMMRTYLSPANEEETDLDQVRINEESFYAIYDGYLSAMGDELSPAERKYFIYAGKFIIYMQAIRFLADFLDNDRYYQTEYTDHNLNRAKNQIRLLQEYLRLESKFQRHIDTATGTISNRKAI